MKKATAINYKGSLYNEDGDRPINLDKIDKISSKKEMEEAFTDDTISFMIFGEDKIYGVDKLKFNGQNFLLLEPNPVPFYFSLAYDSLSQIENARKGLKKTLNFPSNDGLKAQAFSFLFRVSSVCVIFSFSALEAFLNQSLPDYELIEYKGKMLGKKRIEKQAIFKDKLNIIIPKILNKDFQLNNPLETEILLNLKIVRDKLIHLKEVRNGFTSYNDIYQELLDTNFQEIVVAVKKYINFYSPDLIINYNDKTQIK